MRKLAAIILAVAMLAAFAIPASAATRTMGAFDETGWANYWWSDGADERNPTTGLTLKMLDDATRLVVEFSIDMSEEYLEFIYCPSNPGFIWITDKINEHASLSFSGNTLTVDFSKLSRRADVFGAGHEGIKVGIGADQHVIDAITSATLHYGSAPPISSDGGADDKGGVDTGVGDVAVASAIALVAVGAVVFSRKKK